MVITLNQIEKMMSILLAEAEITSSWMLLRVKMRQQV